PRRLTALSAGRLPADSSLPTESGYVFGRSAAPLSKARSPQLRPTATTAARRAPSACRKFLSSPTSREAAPARSIPPARVPSPPVLASVRSGQRRQDRAAAKRRPRVDPPAG